MAIEGAEARGRQGLFDGRPILHLRITRDGGMRMGGQTPREPRIQQARIGRSRAMMDQSHNRSDREVSEPHHPLVAPAPGRKVGAIGGDAFPQDRIAKSPATQGREAVQVIGAQIVPKAWSDRDRSGLFG